MRPRLKGRCATVLVLLGAAPAPGSARAAAPDSAHSPLGVVEIRTGSAQLHGLGDRLAELARRATHLEVVGPAEAHRRAGSDLDATVARCGGDGACLASAGRRIGVDKLLVAAVSQLGDVIVALQLVDVPGRKIAGRLAESLPPGSKLGDADLREWLERVLPRDAFVLYGTLAVHASVEGAEVEIDGLHRGQAPLPVLRLEAPRLYQVRVTSPGRKPFGISVDLSPGATVEVMATLPPREAPLWKRPWVWAAAAGVLAAGALTGVYLSSRPPDAVAVTARVCRPPDCP